ncbi:formylglycine-generating enzyme family protein [Ekhidna sp.]
MKKLIYLIAILSTSVLFGFDKPEDVPSKITELRTNKWYREILLSWKDYLEVNPEYEEGWVNYYKASKYAGKPDNLLDEIVNEVKERFPNTFTSHYITFHQHGWDENGIIQLEQALDLDKSGVRALEDRLALSYLKNDQDKSEISKKVFDEGLIHSSTLNYNYNLLMSVSDNGILITDAIHTTIPIWVLQDVMGVRKDVSVLNLELASDESYVTNVLEEKNLQASVDDLMSVENQAEVFYALTLPRKRLENLENNLYVIGLASTNGDKSFNHFEILRENIEDRFLLDYLTIDFNGEPKYATGNVLSSNYIVPLLLLKEFYDNLNNDQRSEEIRDQILSIAGKSKIKTRVELLLNSRKASRTFKIVELETKKIDKSMKPMKDDLFVSNFELTNNDFWFFMEYLRTNGYSELYEKSKPDLSKYDDVTKALLFNYQYSPANAQSVKVDRGGNYLDYPVIDITHETAKAYCEWLTVQYNAQEKRKYKKVEFRLPTKEEWMIAALGYKDFTSWKLEENTVKAKEKEGKAPINSYDLSEHTISYPWYNGAWNYRNNIKNSKDCYLANIKVPEDVICAGGVKGDGFTFAAPVGSYFANGMGLYDVVGNISEMTQTPGEAMGGSWNHSAEEATIQSITNYEGSDISVGFRLFMEVIEE